MPLALVHFYHMPRSRGYLEGLAKSLQRAVKMELDCPRQVLDAKDVLVFPHKSPPAYIREFDFFIEVKVPHHPVLEANLPARQQRIKDHFPGLSLGVWVELVTAVGS